jgi:hypothetical protein
VQFRQTNSRSFLFTLTLLCSLVALPVYAQRADPKDPQNGPKGVELIKAAAATRGGATYLKFKTLHASGQFTAFDNGISTSPKQFLDWIVYPDRERVEFGKGKRKDRTIQVNTGNTGWIYDGDAETLKDQSAKQVADFQEGIEFDLDHILRGGWQQPGVEVRFYGREEIRPGERADVVEIKFSAEKVALLTLDRNTKLPMTLAYDKSEGRNVVKREIRFFQYVTYDGVKFPNIVDFFRDGVQESRVNYQLVQLDAPVPEELFVKPASVKAIK